MCRGCMRRMGKSDVAYLPCIQENDKVNGLEQISKISKYLYYVQSRNEILLMNTETSELIRVIMELDKAQILNNIVIKDIFIVITKSTVFFFKIEKYDIILLRKVDDIFRQYVKAIPVPFKGFVGICWQNDFIHFDLFDISHQDNIHRVRTSSTDNTQIVLPTLTALKSKGYYLHQEGSQFIVSKLKFHQRLIIRNVKVFDQIHFDRFTIEILNWRGLKDILIGNYNSQPFAKNTFLDLKKLSQKQLKNSSYRGNLPCKVLPGFHPEKSPYYLSNEGFNLYLYNYANNQSLYHMLDYRKNLIIRKASIPMVDCQYDGKPQPLNEMLLQIDNPEEVKEATQQISSKQEVPPQKRHQPYINHEATSTFANYDLITIFSKRKLRKFRFMLPDC